MAHRHAEGRLPVISAAAQQILVEGCSADAIAESSVQACSTSATDQAWAMQPRGAWGESPSAISLMLPMPASPR